MLLARALRTKLKKTKEKRKANWGTGVWQTELFYLVPFAFSRWLSILFSRHRGRGEAGNLTARLTEKVKRLCPKKES